MLARPVWSVPQAAAVLLCGLGASVLTLAVADDWKYAVLLLVGASVALLFTISGNLRLACLCALVLLAPLRLGRAFHVIPHMGGAAAFWFDGIDVLIAALLWWQWRDRRTAGVRRPPLPGALRLWLGLIALGLLSAMIAPYRMVALHEVVRMTKLLLLAWVLLQELRRRQQFQYAFVMLMLGVIFNSLLAVAQWIAKRDFGLSFLGEADPTGSELIGAGTLLTREFVYRPGGLMGAGNLFAAYLALLVPMAVAVVLSPAPRWLRALSAGAVVVSIPALVLTLSRSGWLAFAVGFCAVLVLGLWHPASRRMYMTARAAVVTAVVLLGTLMSPMIIQRLVASDPNAIEVRLEWLETAKKMVQANPLLGVGLNKYVFTQIAYGKDTTVDEMNARYGELWPVVHSTWVVTWAEQGTLGMALFVAMHLTLIAAGVRNLRLRDPLMHALAAGLLAGVLAIMADGVGSFFLRLDQHARVFWMVVAMLLAAHRLRRQEAAAPTAASAGEAQLASLSSPSSGPSGSALAALPRRPTSPWLPAPGDPVAWLSTARPDAPRRAAPAAPAASANAVGEGGPWLPRRAGALPRVRRG